MVTVMHRVQRKLFRTNWMRRLQPRCGAASVGGGTGGSDPGIWSFRTPKSPTPFLSSLRGSLPPVPSRRCECSFITNVDKPATRFVITETITHVTGREGGHAASIHEEPKPPKGEQLAVRLNPDTLEMLESYCEFINSSTYYVVEEALRYTFRKDKELQQRLLLHGTTGRKRKAEPKAPEAGAGTGRTGVEE